MIRRRLAIFVILSLISGVTAWLGSQAEGVQTYQTNLLQADGDVRVPVGLRTTRTHGLPASALPTSVLPDLNVFRPPGTAVLKIALISSGVSPNAFPAPLNGNFVSQLHYAGDPVGYGTYASTVIFQLKESVQITSIGVYPGGVFSPSLFEDALGYVSQGATNFDVVLLAIHPSDFLDPMSAAMATAGDWDAVVNAILSAPVQGPTGPVFGVAMNDAAFAGQGASQSNWNALSDFRARVGRFTKIRQYIKTITDAGVAVTVPAGDLGPKPQTIFGVANLPEVITVGSVNSSGDISPATSSGPTIDLRIKPDLLATSGIMGLVPTPTMLADFIVKEKLSNSTLMPAWSAVGNGSEQVVKAALDSTLTAASLVAVALAALRSQSLAAGAGLDVARQKGALYAKSFIDPDIPIYRQGQGILGGTLLNIAIPTATFAALSPLVLSHGDLGMEPNNDPWSVSITVSTGTAQVGDITVQDFVGVDLDAKVTTTSISVSSAPSTTATVAGETIILSSTTGSDDKEAGLYCGSLGVSLTATGAERNEKIPLCLMNGFKPVARSFAIHNDSANQETFMLTPTLPLGSSMIDHPIHMLPIDPTNTSLFMKVSTQVQCPLYTTAGLVPSLCDGHSQFDVVPPGYYSVREFSDYGAQYNYDVNVKNATTGLWEPQTKNADLGSEFGYTSFKTLLLPKLLECERSYGAHDDWSGHGADEGTAPGQPEMWKKCTMNSLNEKLAELHNLHPELPEKKAIYDGPSGGFLVTHTSVPQPVPDDLRINLGFIRKPIGTTITSRVIDIVHPCSELRFHSFRTPQVATLETLSDPQGQSSDWQSGCDNLETLVARLTSPAAQTTGHIGVGMATYPFNLTTPNYRANFALNFSYEVNNAIIVAMVHIGGEAAAGFVSPKGVVQLPPSGLNPQLDDLRLEAPGFGQGKASFHFGFLPKGESRGAITFFFVPMQYDSSGYHQTLGSWAKIKDEALTNDTMSFELKTWTPGEWPALNFKNRRNEFGKVACPLVSLPDNDCGHTFQVNSRFNPIVTNTAGDYIDGQILGECRTIDGTESANVCEDWTVLVHSPKLPLGEDPNTSASLMDVVDASSTTTYTSIASEIVDAGGRLYVPEPRTSTTTVFAAFNQGLGSPLTGGRQLRTNGSFFEQLVVPMPVLMNHPASLEFCINDGTPRWTDITHTAVSSICGGSGVTTTWSAPQVNVPCIPKLPPKTNFPCEAAPASYSVPKLRPYVNYASTHGWFQ